MHHSTARVEELVGGIYDSLRPAAAGEAPAACGVGAAEADAQTEQPSPFGSKENKPQQGATEAAGTAEQPGDAERAGGGAAAEPATARKVEGGAAAGSEQRSGRKPKTPKAPVSRSLLRTYIIEVGLHGCGYGSASLRSPCLLPPTGTFGRQADPQAPPGGLSRPGSLGDPCTAAWPAAPVYGSFG